MKESSEQVKKDIAEAFDLARFLIKNPRELKGVRNGAQIKVIPAAFGPRPKSRRSSGNLQIYVSESVFHPL